MKTSSIRWLCLSSLLAFSACHEKVDVKAPMTNDPRFQLELSEVGKARIFFGHQSVGQNLLNGLNSLMDSSAPQVNIIKVGKETELPPGPCLVHAYLGENANPTAKIRDFSEFLDKPQSQDWNAVLLKFCFLDITRNTNVSALFKRYEDTVASLKQRHPNWIFIHATAPLTRADGLKAFVKKILGKRTAEDDNMKRMEYDSLLVSTFGSEPILDISRIESTHPDGSRESFTRSGSTYYEMAREYTLDGGHLNADGSRILAAEFVHVVAEALKRGHP